MSATFHVGLQLCSCLKNVSQCYCIPNLVLFWGSGCWGSYGMQWALAQILKKWKRGHQYIVHTILCCLWKDSCGCTHTFLPRVPDTVQHNWGIHRTHGCAFNLSMKLVLEKQNVIGKSPVCKFHDKFSMEEIHCWASAVDSVVGLPSLLYDQSWCIRLLHSLWPRKEFVMCCISSSLFNTCVVSWRYALKQMASGLMDATYDGSAWRGIQNFVYFRKQIKGGQSWIVW